MKGFAIKIFGMFILSMLFMTSVQAKSVEKQREEIDALSQKVLTRLYEKYPNSERVIKFCYGYATLGATGSQTGFTGDSHGRGIAFNNETGEKVYMKMQEFKLGFGVGIKEFDLVFVFGTKESWDNFISGKFKFGVEANAAATDSIKGASLDGASMVGQNMWVYQNTTKGVSIAATLKGMNIYPNKKLNAEKK